MDTLYSEGGIIMRYMLSRIFIFEGIVLGILGLLFILNPLESIFIFTDIAGWFFIVLAILSVLKIPRDILMSIIDLAIGLILIIMPIDTIGVLIISYGMWSLIKGIYLLIMFFTNKNTRSGIFILYSVATIIFGIIILSNLATGYILLPYIIGTYFILSAILEIFIGFRFGH